VGEMRAKEVFTKRTGPERLVWYLIWLPVWLLYVSTFSRHEALLAATLIAFTAKDVLEAAGRKLLTAPYLEHFPCCLLVAAASSVGLWVKVLAVADGVIDFLDDMGIIRFER